MLVALVLVNLWLQFASRLAMRRRPVLVGVLPMN